MGRDGSPKGIALNALGNSTDYLRDPLQKTGRKKGKVDNCREIQEFNIMPVTLSYRS